MAPGNPAGARTVSAAPAVMPRISARAAVLAATAAGTFLLALVNLGAGPVPASPASVISALLAPLGLAGSRADAGMIETVVWNIRLPRVVLGILSGAALGVSGAALQGLFRNPLAEPGLIGVSSGAAFGAVAAVYWGTGWAGGWVPDSFLMPLAAFAGGGAAAMGVRRLATRGGRTDAPLMLLAGVAVNAILAAFIGLFIYAADDRQMRAITFWMFGSLGGALWESILPAAVLMLVSAAGAVALGRSLNLYLLGEREAGHLGVDAQRLKNAVILVTALGVGASVSLCGIIGFVGLAAPHLLRLMGGADNRFVLPGSALMGAMLLMAADLVARTAAAPAEVPIGMVTSLMGGPFFLYLLIRLRGRAMG